MDDGEAEELLEGIEVPVAVNQGVLLAKAERRDETVDGLAHRAPAAPQSSIVACRLSGQRDTSRLEDLQLGELAFNISRGQVVADTLQQLAEDDVCQSKALVLEFSVQPVRLRVPNTLEVVYPDGGVDDDHAPLLHNPPEAGHIEITVPGDLAS